MNYTTLNKYKTQIIVTSFALLFIVAIVALFSGIKESNSNPAATAQNFQSEPAPIDLKIRGNRSSKIYHLPRCPNYNDIAERNIVNFKTTEEAESKGFRMARNC